MHLVGGRLEPRPHRRRRRRERARPDDGALGHGVGLGRDALDALDGVEAVAVGLAVQQASLLEVEPGAAVGRGRVERRWRIEAVEADRCRPVVGQEHRRGHRHHEHPAVGPHPHRVLGDHEVGQVPAGEGRPHHVAVGQLDPGRILHPTVAPLHQRRLQHLDRADEGVDQGQAVGADLGQRAAPGPFGIELPRQAPAVALGPGHEPEGHEGPHPTQVARGQEALGRPDVGQLHEVVAAGHGGVARRGQRRRRRGHQPSTVPGHRGHGLLDEHVGAVVEQHLGQLDVRAGRRGHDGCIDAAGSQRLVQRRVGRHGPPQQGLELPGGALVRVDEGGQHGIGVLGGAQAVDHADATGADQRQPPRPGRVGPGQRLDGRWAGVEGPHVQAQRVELGPGVHRAEALDAPHHLGHRLAEAEALGHRGRGAGHAEGHVHGAGPTVEAGLGGVGHQVTERSQGGLGQLDQPRRVVGHGQLGQRLAQVVEVQRLGHRRPAPDDGEHAESTSGRRRQAQQTELAAVVDQAGAHHDDVVAPLEGHLGGPLGAPVPVAGAVVGRLGRHVDEPGHAGPAAGVGQGHGGPLVHRHGRGRGRAVGGHGQVHDRVQAGQVLGGGHGRQDQQAAVGQRHVGGAVPGPAGEGPDPPAPIEHRGGEAGPDEPEGTGDADDGRRARPVGGVGHGAAVVGHAGALPGVASSPLALGWIAVVVGASGTAPAVPTTVVQRPPAPAGP